MATHKAIPAQEVGDVLFLDEIDQTARAFEVVTAVNHELLSRVLVDERIDQRPQDGENPRRADDQQTAHRLRVVGLHQFDNPQERFDAWSPHMTHVQPFQVDDARTGTASSEFSIVFHFFSS